MTPNDAMPLLLLATSLVPAVIILALREEQHRARTIINVAGAVLKVALVLVIMVGVAGGASYEWQASFLPQAQLILRVDRLALLFVSLSALLWLATTVYAIAYMEDSPHRSRFFAFFSLCVAATVGIALAGNPITFLLFYELLTIATYPLVVHRGSEASLRAGRTYLLYLVPAGAIVLVAVAWLHALVGAVAFEAGGSLDAAVAEHPTQLSTIFVLFMVGLGFKAALIPLHGWLPSAMVAPAPVSALLHAVAVVKAGAYGIILVVFELYGIQNVAALGLLTPFAAVACITILYGSLRALGEDELKRRLAFSTVSQVSYIVLGVMVFSPLAAVGGLAHLVHQGLMKATLFYCAGSIAETHGLHRVSELNGIGRAMPWTMGCFTVGALGMIGVPPTAGFVSKWYLGLGALDAGMPLVLGVLVVSTLLNAMYFLPIIHRAWFRPPDEAAEPPSASTEGVVRQEASRGLLIPTICTAAASVAVGVAAGLPFSPLAWATQVVETFYAVGAPT